MWRVHQALSAPQNATSGYECRADMSEACQNLRASNNELERHAKKGAVPSYFLSLYFYCFFSFMVSFFLALDVDLRQRRPWLLTSYLPSGNEHIIFSLAPQVCVTRSIEVPLSHVGRHRSSLWPVKEIESSFLRLVATAIHLSVVSRDSLKRQLWCAAGAG